MGDKNNKINVKTLVLYGAFGLAIAFAVTILFYFISHELVPPLLMGIVIGILIALAYKLFRDAIKREQRDQ